MEGGTSTLERVRTLKVQTKDSKQIIIDWSLIRQSLVLQAALQKHSARCESGDNNSDEPVQFGFHSTILQIIMEWCKHYKDEEPQLHDRGVHSRNDGDVSVWDARFFDVDAANYLNMKGLLDVACKVCADMVQGKTTEEMREFFGIKNDWSEEAEQEMMYYQRWMLDLKSAREEIDEDETESVVR